MQFKKGDLVHIKGDDTKTVWEIYGETIKAPITNIEVTHNTKVDSTYTIHKHLTKDAKHSIDASNLLPIKS